MKVRIMPNLIYLDICCFNRPYDDQSQLKVSLETQAKLHIQDLILKKELNLVWSYILAFENSKSIYPAKRNSISKWEKLSSDFIGRSEDLIVLAKTVAATGIKEMDSLHIACAIVAGCDYLISVDRRLCKYEDARIKICNPLDFVSEYGR
jgi:predicted nucleic acid-binding protein